METVEEFTEVAEKYILYIKDRAAEGVRLVPDVEGFCSFAGISRETLNNWETARPGAYSDTIKRLKTSIAAFKKQLAFAGKIPADRIRYGYEQQPRIYTGGAKDRSKRWKTGGRTTNSGRDCAAFTGGNERKRSGRHGRRYKYIAFMRFCGSFSFTFTNSGTFPAVLVWQSVDRPAAYTRGGGVERSGSGATHPSEFPKN